MSAQSCGCDREAGWTCEWHRMAGIGDARPAMQFMGIDVPPTEKTVVIHGCKRQGCTFVSTDPDVVIRHSIRECTAAFVPMGEPREAE